MSSGSRYTCPECKHKPWDHVCYYQWGYKPLYECRGAGYTKKSLIGVNIRVAVCKCTLDEMQVDILAKHAASGSKGILHV